MISSALIGVIASQVRASETIPEGNIKIGKGQYVEQPFTWDYSGVGFIDDTQGAINPNTLINSNYVIEELYASVMDGTEHKEVVMRVYYTGHESPPQARDSSFDITVGGYTFTVEPSFSDAGGDGWFLTYQSNDPAAADYIMGLTEGALYPFSIVETLAPEYTLTIGTDGNGAYGASMPNTIGQPTYGNLSPSDLDGSPIVAVIAQDANVILAFQPALATPPSQFIVTVGTESATVQHVPQAPPSMTYYTSENVGMAVYMQGLTVGESYAFNVS